MTWVEACHDKSLENLPYKIELNGQGQIIMSSTRNKHGFYQAEITYLLRPLLTHGHVFVECAIDTPEGTYVADVAWATTPRFKIIEEEFSCSISPEICVEIWSQSNSPKEIEMKRRLYFEKGALEFWYCDETGRLTFFDTKGQLMQSKLCPNIPSKVGA